MLFLSLSLITILIHSQETTSDGNAEVTVTQAPAASGPIAYQRHPMRPVTCAQLPKAQCYGIAADLTAEQDGVCGWSPTEQQCAVVSIGEEGKEGSMCFMHKTLASCIASNVDPTAMFGVPPGMADPIEHVCAWNPYMAMCKDGQLEEEPGDMSFGVGTGRGCAWGNPTALSCPAPLCVWSRTANACVGSGMSISLAKTLETTKPEKSVDAFAIAGYALGGFGIGLALTCGYVHMRSRKSYLSQPLSMERVV